MDRLSRLYWTPENVTHGWLIERADDGTWRAEEMGGPGVLMAATLVGLLRDVAGEEIALQRRYTETQVRAAALDAGCDPIALVTRLRA
jgi:hypothetical protein